MSIFSEAIDYVLENEGGLSDEAHDAGGLTKFGLSFYFIKNLPMESLKNYGLLAADDEHLKQLLEDIDIETAKKIYFGEFWVAKYFDLINSQKICNYYFDCAINHGQAQATKLLQRSVWAYTGNMNRVIDDGVMGRQTLDSVNFYGQLLLPSFRSERAGFYRAIVAKTPSQEKFINGWLARAYR